MRCLTKKKLSKLELEEAIKNSILKSDFVDSTRKDETDNICNYDKEDKHIIEQRIRNK